MKSFSKLLILIILISGNSCSLGLDNEIHRKTAELMIEQSIINFSNEQLEECSAEQVIVNNGDYLFIENSFNGDFNGSLYSTKKTSSILKAKFDDFYITSNDSTEGNWTKVYGKW